MNTTELLAAIEAEVAKLEANDCDLDFDYLTTDTLDMIVNTVMEQIS